MPRHAKAGLVGALALAAAAHTHAADFAGKVVHVQDGDTLTVLVDQRQVKVRLAWIDAPEGGQAYGKRSQEHLAQLCHSRQASVVVRPGQDRHKRTLGTVTCDGVDANAEQVRAGMAWVFPQYAPKRSPLYALEAAARTAGIGLWSDQDPMPPWIWRGSRTTSPTTGQRKELGGR